MSLAGEFVTIHLNALGKRELGAVLNLQETVDAVVMSQDTVGLWVTTDTEFPPEVMLIKWQHFTTVRFDYSPASPNQRGPAGFKP